MQASDLDAVIANELRAYAFPWTRGIFEECLEGEHDCRVACVDDQIIGHAVASFAAGESHLLNVCIRRESQGFGYGRELVVHMLERCRNFGASVLFLEVRPSNHVAGNLYETLGFNEIGIRRNYYPADTGHEDARVLVLDLEKFVP
jgi:[ribosomal protein S18]-alanine N-acetyltransferase